MNSTKPPPPPSNWMQEAFANNPSTSSRQNIAPNFNQTIGLPPITAQAVPFYKNSIPQSFSQNSQNPAVAVNNIFSLSQPSPNSMKQQPQQQFYRPQPFSPEKNRQFDRQNRHYSNQRNSDFGNNGVIVGNRPNGPNILNSNDMGNGAFIPLQAAKKALSKKQNQKNKDSSHQVVSEFVQRNTVNRHATQQAQEIHQQNFAKFLDVIEKDKKSPVNVEDKVKNTSEITKPKMHEPRSSRIAARFPTANN